MNNLWTSIFILVFCRSILAEAPIEFPHRGSNGEWILCANASTVAFSPDETTLAAAGSLGVFLIDLQSKNLDIRKWFPIENATIDRVEYFPDGRSLLITYSETQLNPIQILRRLDIDSGQILQTYTLPKSRIMSRQGAIPNQAICLCVSPDGAYVLTGNYDSTATLLDAQTGAVLHHLDAHILRRTDMIYETGTTAVAFSPESDAFLTGAWDGAIKQWDADAGKEIQEYKGHSSEIQSLQFSSDGSKFLSCVNWRRADGTIRVWNTASGETIVAASSQSSPKVYDVRWLDGENRFISAAYNPLLEVWNARTGECEGSDSSDSYSRLSKLSPRGTWLYTNLYHDNAKIWNLSNLNAPTSRTLDFHSISKGNILSDGRFFTIDENNRLILWKYDKGTPIRLQAIDVDGAPVSIVSFDPTGRYMLTDSPDRNGLLVWDLHTLQAIQAIDLDNFGSQYTGVKFAVFSPSKKRLAAAFNDGVIQILDCETKEIIHTLQMNGFTPVWAEFSPDGEKLLVCHRRNSARYSVRLWDVQTGEILRLHQPVSYNIQPIPAPINGRWVYADFTDDGNPNTCILALWDGYTGEERQIALDWPTLRYDIRFTPDGRYVWAEAPYVGVKVFDAHNGRAVKTFSHAQTADIAPDSSWALTYGYGTIRLWDLNLPSFISNWETLH